MTSNLGAKHLLSGLKAVARCKLPVIKSCRRWGSFKPELLNRLDEIVAFDPLLHEQLRKVAGLQMKDVASRLAEQGIALAFAGAVLNCVLARNYDPAYGARPSRRWLKKKVVTELSKMIVMDEDSTVRINAGPNKQDLVYRVEKNGSNDEDELEIEDEALKNAHRSKT